jgi:hypothetical protein
MKQNEAEQCGRNKKANAKKKSNHIFFTSALDARCLLDVFDVLTKWMTEANIVIDLNECSPRLPWLFPKRSR